MHVATKLGAIGAGALALTLAGQSLVAVANPLDPPVDFPGVPNHYVAAGSDTIQDLYNAFQADFPLDSYNAFAANGKDTDVITVDGASLARPNGSGAGVLALSASWNPASNMYLGTPTGGSATRYLLGQGADATVDIARSSSGAGSNLVAGGFSDALSGIVYVPLARDAVSVATNGLPWLTNLTTEQINALYITGSYDAAPVGDSEGDVRTSSGDVQINHASAWVTVDPLIPQSASGTRKFFLKATTGSETPTLGGWVTTGIDAGSNNIPENSGAPLTAVGQLIPFSAAQWTAQWNGLAPTFDPEAVGFDLDLVSINGQAAVEYEGDMAEPGPLFGDTTAVPSTSVGTYARDVFSVIPKLAVTALEAGAKVASAFATPLSTLVAWDLPNSPKVAEYGFLPIEYSADTAQWQFAKYTNGVLTAADTSAEAGESTKTYVATGSDTIQDLYNAFADDYGIDNYNAFAADGKSTDIITVNGVDFARPNGSGAGVKALSASWNPASDVYDATPTGGSATRYLFPQGPDSIVDIARSSSGAGSAFVAGGFPSPLSGIVYIPLARDAVSVAAKGLPWLTNLTTEQINALYVTGNYDLAPSGASDGDVQTASGAVQVYNAGGWVTVNPLIPQSASGTRKFFLKATTGSETPTLGGWVTTGIGGTNNIPENSAAPLTAAGQLIPFSAAQWTAQWNGLAPTFDPEAVGFDLGLVSINGQAAVEYDGDMAEPGPLYGDTSVVPSTAVGTYARDVFSVISKPNVTAVSGGTQIASATATPLSTLVSTTLPADASVTEYGFLALPVDTYTADPTKWQFASYTNVVNTAADTNATATALEVTQLTGTEAPQSVLLEATVTRGGGAVTTGNVQFSVDGAVVGTAPVTSGSFTTVELAAGDHTFRAAYLPPAGRAILGSVKVESAEISELAAPAITTTSLANGAVGLGFNRSVVATGTPTPTFAITAGTIPAGTAFSSAGVFSGVPTTPGTYTFTVTASNGVTPVATKEFSVTIAAGTIPAGTPTITGTAKIGSTLTAVVPSNWASIGASAKSYQWYVAGAKVTTGGTASTFKVPATAGGKAVTVEITGAKAGYADRLSAKSAATGIPLGVFTTKGTKVSGTAKVGVKLTAVKGTWAPTAKVTYAWYVGAKKVGSSSSYTPKAADKGKAITLKVTGTATGYAAKVVLVKTKAIAAGALTAKTPTISGTAKAGSKLTAKPGKWAASTVKVTFKYQWLSGGKSIKGATKSTYTVKAADKGKKISVKVTGSATGYKSVSKTSTSKSIAK